jgi:hypothetical protein
MGRKAIVAMIHVGKARMGWDDATYRAWLEKHTAKTSCALCNETELSHLADELRRMGALDKPGAAPRSRTGVPGARGAGRPTESQWETALGIAKRIGLSGEIDDPSLIAFCKRVAKVEHPRFLDRDGMSALINGLYGWQASKLRHRDKPATG